LRRVHDLALDDFAAAVLAAVADTARHVASAIADRRRLRIE
jgi:hypothetical protein